MSSRILFQEKVFNYGIELLCDALKLLVQIQRLHADSVPAHLIGIVRLDLFLRSGIQQHAGNGLSAVLHPGVLVFDIGKDLIEIVGMDRVIVKLGLGRAGIVFGVDDQRLMLCIAGRIVPTSSSRAQGICEARTDNSGCSSA